MSNATSQSQSAKQETGSWRAADGSSGANYDHLGTEAKNSRANLSGRVQNGSVYYTEIDVYQTGVTSTNNAGSGFALGSTTNSHTVGSTQTIESRGGNSGSWYGSKLESGNRTTNYTTVSGTMGQPFSGMTQTGFNTTTLYGTAAQTGITGMYGSYGQTGTVTPAPFTFVLADGTPRYSTAGGGYLGNRLGILSGSMTSLGVETGLTTGYSFRSGNGLDQSVLVPENMTSVEEIGSFVGDRAKYQFQFGDPIEHNGLLKFSGSDVMRFLNIQKNIWFGLGGETFEYSTFKQGCMGLNKLRLNNEKGPFHMPNSRVFATLSSAVQAQREMIKEYDSVTRIVISAYQDDFLDDQLKVFLLPNSKNEYDFGKIKMIRSGNVEGAKPNGNLLTFDFITIHQRPDLSVLFYETMDFGSTSNPKLNVKHISKILSKEVAGTIYFVTPIRNHYRAPLSPKGVR